MSTEKNRTWLIIGTIWAVVLLGLAIWSSFNGPKTVRDQSALDSGKQTIETVIDEIKGAVPAAASLQDGGYVEMTCRITPVREGINASRTLTVNGIRGSEPQTLHALNDRLKGSRLQPGSGVPTGFFYDAGNFIVVRGEVTSPGVLAVTFQTGCRPSN